MTLERRNEMGKGFYRSLVHCTVERVRDHDEYWARAGCLSVSLAMIPQMLKTRQSSENNIDFLLYSGVNVSIYIDVI
jgi:hypothetical protein